MNLKSGFLEEKYGDPIYHPVFPAAFYNYLSEYGCNGKSEVREEFYLIDICYFAGDRCVTDGVPGVCTFFPQCPPMYQNALIGQFPRQVCGFSNLTPIVCCPQTMTTRGARAAIGIYIHFNRYIFHYTTDVHTILYC